MLIELLTKEGEEWAFFFMELQGQLITPRRAQGPRQDGAEGTRLNMGQEGWI